MNSAIEILNHWGGSFLDFARSMLWQSSVLALVLLALDFGLRHRVRAAVRHGLWLVLLVKLVLPTDLALPTSPAWWWSRANAVPVVAAPVVTPNYVVTQEDVLTPDISTPDWVESVPMRPSLTPAAASLLLAGAVSLGLLAWLLRRWRQVVRASRAALPDAELALRLGEARELTRLRSSVPVKLTQATMSPAVCGLFRPVILLPSALAETLAPAQLRAVLLHELMHVRRGDVWVNLAQSLLQIVYWWHPLVWLANARIRRVREEAVDEAVMVALRGEADIYAPTLLAVAKFALHRPFVSLGLVGILESRSALRQRIERLVTLPVPRRAGLGVLGALGIVAFSAMALPMGEAPPLPPQPAPEVAAASTKKTPWPDPRFEGYRNVNLLEHFLIIDKSALQTGVPVLANSRGPLIIPPADLDGVFTQLRQAGGRFFNEYPEGVGQEGFSGAYMHYVIGGGTNTGGNTSFETTNSGGRNILTGLEMTMPATQPDWTPMELTLHPWLADTGTRCQFELTVGGQVQTAQPAEVVIPPGGALAWVVPTPAQPGKCQVMLVMSWEATNQAAEGPLVTQTFPVPVAKLQAAWQARGWPTNGNLDPWVMIYSFIHDAGLNWLPPRNFSYTNSLLEVQAPAADVAVIAKLLANINPVGPVATNAAADGNRPTDNPAMLFEHRTIPIRPPFRYYENGVWLFATPAGTNRPFKNNEAGGFVAALLQDAGLSWKSPRSCTYNLANDSLEADAPGQELDVLAAFVAHFNADRQSDVAGLCVSQAVEARWLYEAGRLEEAAANFKQLLAMDPTIDKAHYYLELIKQAQTTGAPVVAPHRAQPLRTFSFDEKLGLPRFRQQAGLTAETTAADYEAGFTKLLGANDHVFSTNNLWWLGKEDILLVRGTAEELAAAEQAYLTLYGDAPDPFKPPAAAAATIPLANPHPITTFSLSAATGLPRFRQQTGLTANSSAADYLAAFNQLLGAKGSALPANSLWLGDQGLLLVRGTPAELDAVNELFGGLNVDSPPGGKAPAAVVSPAPRRSTDLGSGSGPAAMDDTHLITRTFKINTHIFYTALQKALGTNVPIAPKALAGGLRDLFGRFGVDLAAPKALFYNDRLGLIFVKATGDDLEAIERVVQTLNQPAATNATGTPDDQSRTPPGERQWVLPKHTPSSANANAATNLTYSGPGRQNLLNKLDRIRLATNSFEHVPLREVLRQLSKQAKLLDPEKQGINFLINPQVDSITGVDPATGLPPTNQVDVGATLINVHLTDIRLADALDALVLVADRPIQYSIQDFGVVFSPKLPAAATLNWRVFKISLDTLKLGLGLAGPIDTPAGKSPNEAVLERLREYLSHREVNLDPPKALNYNDSRGMLAVKASEADLDAVEQLIESWQKVTVPPPPLRPELHSVDKMLDSWSTPAPTPSGPTNQEAVTVTATNAPDVSQLMIDAMALYESRRGDEARLKLAQVLRMDPANPAALYYWRLVHASAPAAGAGRVTNTNVPPGASSFQLSPPPGSITNPSTDTITGISTNPNFKAAIHALEQRSGVEKLAEPEVITTSGRGVNRGDVPLHFDLPVVPAPTNARPANVSRPHLLTQAYQFDRLIFSSGLQKALGVDAPVPSVEVTNALLTLFRRAGVTLAGPESIDFNEPRGALLVQATREEQKTIAEVLGRLPVNIRPQLHIKARFIEVTGDITNPPALAHPPSGPNETAIVDGNLVRPWLHELERRPGTTMLAEPEVTTTTGRQTQMRSTTMMSVIAGVNPKALTPPGLTRFEATNGPGFFVVTNEEFGPVFDVVPQVLADGCTINVRILAMANEFAGYDKPTHDIRVYVDDLPTNGPANTIAPPIPRFNERQFRAAVNLYDRQALILTQPIDPRTGLPSEQTGKKAKHLLVVMSVDIVDAAGNRVHKDEEMPFAHDRVPPQPAQSNAPLDDRPFKLPPLHVSPKTGWDGFP